MAKYQVTFELTTRLSREVEPIPRHKLRRFAEAMYQEYLKGDNNHVIGTETPSER